MANLPIKPAYQFEIRGENWPFPPVMPMVAPQEPEEWEHDWIGDLNKADVEDFQEAVAGVKFDQDKPRMDLLDPSFTEGVAQVLTFGAKKYAADNWRGGLAYTRLISSIHRHLAAIQKGEDIDVESGLPHVYHIGCNCQFLGWMMQNKPELDDRYKAK